MLKPLNNTERFAWVLLQSLWVGGLWVTILVVYPSLNKTLLSPVLIEDVVKTLAPRVIFMAIICVICQLLLFVKSTGIRLIIRNPIALGQLVALLFSILFVVLHFSQVAAYQSMACYYIMIGLCGMFTMFFIPPWLAMHRKHYEALLENS